MTNDPLYQQMRERSWRRRLTDAEAAELRAWQAAHPEAQADWEAEAGLNEALGRMADVPVPSNFTARVLQAVERESAGTARGRATKWGGWRRWLPRLAFVSLVLGAGLFSRHEFQAAERAKLVHSVAVVSKVSSLPSPTILEDFDAIRALTPAPADGELLSALQ